jgi:DNA (cytosine-5)-methyltransferase 1
MRYLSVCSGIEAATVAWHPLGWQAVAYSEIEKFPSAVLAHHYPDVPNVGDMTKYKEWNLGAVDLLVGGTPCQSFSVAGLRKGLEDPRGNLALVYCGILDHLRPKWFVWENVPGVLSSSGGRDFGSFLGALAELGYGFAYRVLDAQYFGVAQRRRRVFVVGHLGDWRPAAEVLFESESLRGNPAPSRKAGQRAAPCVTNGPPFSRTGNERVECEAIVTVEQPFELGNTLTARMHKGMNSDCNEGQTPVLSYALQGNMIGRSDSAGPQGDGINEELSFTQNCVDRHGVAIGMSVRRLTPVECERLQGFPDNYTNIPWRKADQAPDGPRYKALGNSMAVPVMQWIGKRIMEKTSDAH